MSLTLSSADELIRLISSQGVLSPERILDESVAIQEINRRNNNVVVLMAKPPSFIVKQGGHTVESTVSNEANIYQLIHNHSHLAPLATFIPTFYQYSDDSFTLVTQFIESSKTLTEIITENSSMPIQTFRKLGEALAYLHRTPLEGINGRETGFTPVEVKPPWVMTLAHPDSASLSRMSSVNVEVLKIIQEFPSFSNALSSLAEDWQWDSLVHGDLKWDNLLCSTDLKQAENVQLHIIDWELCGIGDSAWDIGAIFTAALSNWHQSIPVMKFPVTKEQVEQANFSLAEIRPCMNNFWKTYVKTRELDGDQADELMLRAVKYTAARTVQFAFETTLAAVQMPGEVALTLQLAENILEKPEIAATHLLGLPISFGAGDE